MVNKNSNIIIIMPSGNKFMLIESNYDTYATYRESPNNDFAHIKQGNRCTYKSIVINGKFYIPKMIKNE